MTLISPLTGNLGNHMWIYGITRMVAERNNYKWGFNPRPEFDYHSGQPQMEFMDIDYGVVHGGTYLIPPLFIKNIWKEYYETRNFENGDSIDFHPFQPEVFDIEDDTQLYIRCMQDARYLNDVKESVANWFKIKDENVETYETQLKGYNIELNDNLVVLNIRGGEYKGIPSLILRKEYWQDAINIMRDRNSNSKFLCVSDDITYANKILDHKIPVVHLSIGGDYYIVNNAKNLILSNSSFAIFPSWLNKNNPYVIAPKYWARHNVSLGYWASSDISTFGWNFLDREGNLDESI